AQASPQSIIPSSMASESWKPMDSELTEKRNCNVRPLQLEPALLALSDLALHAKTAGPNDLAKALGF
ncbi:hypothetical protein ACLBWS_17795, partial [Brucellaceae bacterium D45D]